MSNFDKYKKPFLIIIVVFLLGLISIKFSLGLLKSEVSNIINSKKFEVWVSNQVNNKIQNFADKDLTEEQYEFYKKNFLKIYIKFKPIFDEIIRETN
tara:strand:- start:5 stop:295 length:291 start_codon:yes stop_codon:yes gene_type:complete